jgi:hypothetical protein
MTVWKSGSASVWPLSIYDCILQEVKKGSRALLVAWAIAAVRPEAFFPRLARGNYYSVRLLYALLIADPP